jgi:NAD(P)H-flavin reductase
MQLLTDSQYTDLQLRLFITGTDGGGEESSEGLPDDTTYGRITRADLDASLGELDKRQGTLCYICGPQVMTDAFVEYLSGRPGMAEDRVLAEKWW